MLKNLNAESYDHILKILGTLKAEDASDAGCYIKSDAEGSIIGDEYSYLILVRNILQTLKNSRWKMPDERLEGTVQIDGESVFHTRRIDGSVYNYGSDVSLKNMYVTESPEAARAVFEYLDRYNQSSGRF